MPRVSVIIPVYNGAATIAQALDSAIAQSFTDREITVVNDGSNDETARILEKYGGRIATITQPNRGLSAARNAGIRASSGTYVAFLDADDIWMPRMLEKTVATLDSHPESALVFTDLAIVDSSGCPLQTTLAGAIAQGSPTLEQMLKQLYPIMPSAVLMRREILEQIGGFSEEFRSYGYEDVYCWLCARELGNFEYLAEKLVLWRFSLFPRALKKISREDAAAELFKRLALARWSVDVSPLIRARQRAPRTLLGYIGLRALRDGDRSRARAAFMRALRYDPLRMKNYFRLLRTFLPHKLAVALGGRTQRDARVPGAEP